MCFFLVGGGGGVVRASLRLAACVHCATTVAPASHELQSLSSNWRFSWLGSTLVQPWFREQFLCLLLCFVLFFCCGFQAPSLPQSPKDSGISRADLWAFAGMVAVEHGIQLLYLSLELFFIFLI